VSRDLDANAVTGLSQQTTAPLFLVHIEWGTPAYYSTRETVSWDGVSWLAADVKLRWDGRGVPSLEFFNTATDFGTLFRTNGVTGVGVKVYQCHKTSGTPQGPTGYTPPELLFDGELRDSVIGTTVRVTCRQHTVRRTPRHVIGGSIANHMPPKGTRIVTPSGVVILE